MFLKIEFGCDFAVGTDGYRYVKIDDDSTDEYKAEISEEYAYQNFESYSYSFGDDSSDMDDASRYWWTNEVVDSIPEGAEFDDLTKITT